MKNLDIRIAAAKSGVRVWEIAEALGIADGNLSRRLRKELTEAEKTQIFSIIDEISKRGN